jgi:hypothetical protein
VVVLDTFIAVDPIAITNAPVIVTALTAGGILCLLGASAAVISALLRSPLGNGQGNATSYTVKTSNRDE